VRGWLILTLLAGAGCAPPPAPVGAPPAPGATALAVAADITWLASPLLDGRATGSAGNDSAALYIARAYDQMGLAGAFPGSCRAATPCRPRYDQLFYPPSDVLAEAGISSDAGARNMGAIVPGSDPSLRGEYIVVGAHFDHLGRTGYGARDPRFAHQPHLGADDNASGTAAVLELARRLAARPVRRSVILVNFGSEELGEFGSRAFVMRPPVLLDSIAAMVNIDMVGWLRRDRVYVYGLASSPEWRGLLNRANATTHLDEDLNYEHGLRNTGSDHDNFAASGIPAVHFTTGIHDAWHTIDDKVDRLDIPGEMRVINLIENLVRLIGDSAKFLPTPRR
jgi:hypothetical protein